MELRWITNGNLMAISIIAAFLIVACDQIAQDNKQAQCGLYMNQQTNEVSCFKVNEQPAGYVPYQKPEIGIPYACYLENGECMLAQ